MKKTKNLLLSAFLLLSVLVLSGCRTVLVKNPLSKNGGGIKVPTVNTTANTAFKPIVLESAGSHSYYSNDFYKDKNLDAKSKKAVERDIMKADKSLNDDVYITGFNSLYSTKDFRLFGCLILDGVVYEDYRMCAEDNGNGICWRAVDPTKTVPTFDLSGVAVPSEFYSFVYEKAEAHVNEIMMAGSNTPITGTYILMVDPSGELYYRFNICEYSHININAKTGHIMEEYYWNGVYID